MTTYAEKFEAFHEAHPEVYDRLVEMARAAKYRGFYRYSIKTLWCVLRFEIDLDPRDEPFKMNDIFHSRYARLIMAQEDGLEDFFQTRCLRSS